MWLFRSIILSYAIAQTKSVASDNLSPLLELKNEGVHWALLVAGSKGWENNRHQADVCHAYQILHKNGIPDERIVVMMYDDIAYNEENPQKGVVINKNGTNVYKDVSKDYTGSAVRANVFLKVLQGQRAGMTELGSGKVIESGPNDNIFVFFSGHCRSGSIQFPDSYLNASTFISTLNKMYNEKKYGKMLIYIDAFHSCSVFKKLPKNMNIVVMTTDSDLKTLNDGVSWMQNSEKVDEKSKQSDFQGSKSDVHSPKDNSEILNVKFDFSNSVSSKDVSLEILIKRWEKASRRQEKEEIKGKLSEYFKERDMINQIFWDIVENITRERELVQKLLCTSEAIMNSECYEKAVDHFYNVCSNYTHSEHILTQMKIFVNLCNERFYIRHITDATSQVCRVRNSTRNLLQMFYNSRNVTLENLIRKWEEARSQQEKEDLKRNFSEYFKERDLISNIFRDIVENITQKKELVENLLNSFEEVTDTECYEEAVDYFYKMCSTYKHSEHVLEYLKIFTNLCRERFDINIITDSTNRVCSRHTQLSPDDEKRYC